MIECLCSLALALTQLTIAPVESVDSLLCQFQELWKQGDVQAAERVAVRARELEPESDRANAAVYAARTVAHGQEREDVVVCDPSSRRLTVSFEAVSLKEAIEALRLHGVNVTLDLADLQEGGVDVDAPVITVHAHLVPLKTVLNLITRPIRLAWWGSQYGSICLTRRRPVARTPEDG
jgi:hypothetical protein